MTQGQTPQIQTIISRNFDNGIGIDGIDYRDQGRPGRRIEADSGHLITGIDFANAGTIYWVLMDGSDTFLPLTDGKTLEASVDVIEQDPGDVAVQLGVGGYIFGKLGSAVGLLKQSNPDAYNVPIFWEETTVKRNNVEMVMRLTPQGENVLIQMQFIDLDSPNQILFDRIAIDTPGQDVVTPLPRTWQTGVEFNPVPEIGETLDFFAVGVFNFTNNPSAEIVFDNLEALQYDAAIPLTIERAVRLTLPPSMDGLMVEGAMSVDGPWEPVEEPIYTHNGMNYMTIPAPLASRMKVFRIVEL